MKKLLLLSALAFGAMTANAATFADYFKVSFDGKTLESGETIMAKDFHDDTAVEAGYTFSVNIDCEAVGDSKKMFGSLDLGTYPTLAEYQTSVELDEDWNYIHAAENGGLPYGIGQACYNGAINSCLSADSTIPGNMGAGSPEVGEGNKLQWQIHLNNCMNETPGTNLKLTLNPVNGDGQPIKDVEFVVNLQFGEKSAVEEVETEFNGVAEYYTLQGVRVANPEKGIYIVKRGAKVQKEFVR